MKRGTPLEVANIHMFQGKPVVSNPDGMSHFIYMISSTYILSTSFQLLNDGADVVGHVGILYQVFNDNFRSLFSIEGLKYADSVVDLNWQRNLARK